MKKIVQLEKFHILQPNEEKTYSNISSELKSSIQNKPCDINDSQTSQKNNKANKSFYRADIDGLRTVAVSIVIFFHMYPRIMVGGFIGVDIFFVISGYLISNIIIKQIKNNKFSYSHFYSRRIKRIYPALLVVLIFVIILACLQMNGRDLQTVSDTLRASTFFSANIQILTYQKGYFDLDVKKNPLLHLWSLGVQQQFYIVWPIFIYFILKKFNNKALEILSFFTISSFILNIIVVYYNRKFCFYFPLCRFWQMAVGGILAYQKIRIQNKKINQILSFIGTGAILATIWIVDENSLFPGFWALVPTISIALIIIAGNETFINKRILSSKPFVFIGKISYPLYLWHWPLLAYMRLFYPFKSKSVFSKPQIPILFTIIFSILTYYFVQNPLRFGKSKKIVWILSIFMLSLCVTSIFISKHPQFFSLTQRSQGQFDSDMIPQEDDYYYKNGKKLVNSSKNKLRLPITYQKLKVSLKSSQHYRIFDQIKETSKYFDNYILSNTHFFQILNQGKDNKLLILGDSHAEYIRPRFKYLYQESVKNNNSDNFPTVISFSNCGRPFLPYHPFFNKTMEYIRHHKINRIFIRNRWLVWLPINNKNGPFHNYSSAQQAYDDFENNSYLDALYVIKQLTSHLKKLVQQGVEVYIATPSVQSEGFNPRYMVDFFGFIQDKIQPVSFSEFRNKNKDFIDLFESQMNSIGAKLIDISDNLCWQDKCQVSVPKGYTIFIDSNHYRLLYSKYWASSLDILVDFEQLKK